MAQDRASEMSGVEGGLASQQPRGLQARPPVAPATLPSWFPSCWESSLERRATASQFCCSFLELRPAELCAGLSGTSICPISALPGPQGPPSLTLPGRGGAPPRCWAQSRGGRGAAAWLTRCSLDPRSLRVTFRRCALCQEGRGRLACSRGPKEPPLFSL